MLIGGFDKVDQGCELNRCPHIIVATPGRLADIIRTTPEFSLKRYSSYIHRYSKLTLMFCRIKYLVLDEADRLMDGKFDKQLKDIWSALPPKRQTLMFSATITDRIQQLKELSKSEVKIVNIIFYL